jgi:hypothetical protein
VGAIAAQDFRTAPHERRGFIEPGARQTGAQELAGQGSAFRER